MDPQAYFSRILSAMEDGAADEFVSAFDDLAKWLERGGAPPVVRSLGVARYRVGPSHAWQFEERPRDVLQSRPLSHYGRSYAILKDLATADRFYFVSYDASGEELASYLLG